MEQKLSVLQCVTLLAESHSWGDNFVPLLKCIKRGWVEGNASGTEEQSEHIL